MFLNTISALAVYVAGVSAFKDTSPYLLFSTSATTLTTSSIQLQSAADALKITKDFLGSCPSDLYVIVSQPNANAVDYSSLKAVPHLRGAMSDAAVKTRLAVSEVFGELSPQEIQDYIISKCNAVVQSFGTSGNEFTIINKTTRPLAVRIDFDPLPSKAGERANKLADNDSLLQSMVDTLPITKYTLMYTTTAVTENTVHNAPSYEPVFMDSFHMEIKRHANTASMSSNDTDVRRRESLFDKYQFFTPGLFMGLLATFLLLSILSVGMAALGSLQVPYGAFEKEMGPAAQKKQQ